jgi:hypothetical protein
MPKQLDLCCKAEAVDHISQSHPFEPLARDATKNSVSRRLQSRTCSKEKGVILYRVKSPDRKKGEDAL